MSEQVMDLRRSAQIVGRHKIVIGLLTALGLLVGIGYSLLRPPTVTSTALVVLPQAAQPAQQETAAGVDGYMATQIVIASSDPVLSGALGHASLTPSLQVLRNDVQVKSPTPSIIAISAQGTSAAQAEARANAVAASYVAYITSSRSGMAPVSAHILNRATSATGHMVTHVLTDSLLGAVLGALLGVGGILAVRSRDRRLFRRDEIANSIGISVLASFPVGHPTDAAGWVRLLEDYDPRDVYGWRLRHALRHLGMVDVNVHNGGYSGVSSLTVVSLSSDLKAVAIGPQLAAYAASLGVPTALVIGSQENSAVTATLRTACAVPLPKSSERSSYLRVSVLDSDDIRQLKGVLTVVVAIVDSRAPQVSGIVRTTATVIGVSTGAATEEQMAKVALSAADDGREIAGILVADPEPTDNTTGRIPQPSRRPQRRSPSLPEETVIETRR